MGKGNRSAGGFTRTAPPDANNAAHKTDAHLPTMIVFDLDDCIWTPEMHELPGEPTVPVEGPLDPLDPDSPLGTVGMRVPARRGRSGRGWGSEAEDVGTYVRLFDGARLALRELALDPRYRGIKLAAASSSLEPSYSHACLRGLEILPGLTLRNMLSYDQIGRTGKLTPRKTTHFRELHKESGVPYEAMLFFDDCNWGDHCEDVNRALGVVGQRTPSGMRIEDFHRGLEKYKKESERRARDEKNEEPS